MNLARSVFGHSPPSHRNVLRSGTWSTIRYAEDQWKKVIKILPEETKVMDERNLDFARGLLARTHRPHQLCKDINGDLWEFISLPYVENGDILVKVRVPGDPTSMITVRATLMDPEDKSCFCSEAGKDFYLEPKYYREREARLRECPAFVGMG